VVGRNGSVFAELLGGSPQFSDLLAQRFQVLGRIVDFWLQRSRCVENRSHDLHQLGKVFDRFAVFDERAHHPGVGKDDLAALDRFGWRGHRCGIAVSHALRPGWNLQMPL
jgi:hypothetical protein